VYTFNTESVIGGAVRAMCWSGSIGFNRYDARFPGGDFTKVDRHKCMFEYDGALKPPAVAFAVGAQLLDGFRGVDPLKLNGKLETFLLKSPDRFAIVVFAADGAVLGARLSLPKGVAGYGIMGNSVPRPPRPVILSNAVTYLIGPASQLARTQALLKTLKPRPAIQVNVRTAIDRKTRQYVLHVDVKNRLSGGPIDGLVDIGGGRKLGVRRDFWAPPARIDSLARGKTARIRLGLNAYRGDKPGGGACSLDITFGGVTFRRAIANVYKVGRH